MICLKMFKITIDFVLIIYVCYLPTHTHTQTFHFKRMHAIKLNLEL